MTELKILFAAVPPDPRIDPPAWFTISPAIVVFFTYNPNLVELVIKPLFVIPPLRIEF
jgi:hypothetical protein